MTRSALAVLFTLCFATANLAVAAPEPADPKKQTSFGLYVTALEAGELKLQHENEALFVDVRDPVEIMFTGFTHAVDINIPFKLVDRNQWNEKKGRYDIKTNSNFESDIDAALKARGLTKRAPIILMCRSGGTRGAPATKLLEGKGYTTVYVVTDGFEGTKIKDGDKKGWRLVNGWKNSGQSWGYKLVKEKMYLPSEPGTE